MGQNSRSIFLYFSNFGPSKPQNWPFIPPMDPILAHFVGILGQFGVKKRVFLKNFFAQNHFILGPRWSGTLKTSQSTLGPPCGPHFGPFCGHFGPIWGKKKRVFLKKNLAPNHFCRFPNRLGPLYTPHLGMLRHFRSPRNRLGLAHKSSALFNT